MNEELSAPQGGAHSSPRDAEETHHPGEVQLFQSNAPAPQDTVRDADGPAEPAQTNKNHSDAVATQRDAETVAQHKNEPRNNRDAEPRSRDADVFKDPFADLSAYTLTVGEAIDRFIELGRVAPKDRTMQEYCKEGKVDCYKLKTTREGRPVAEWLINAQALDIFIKSKPKATEPKSLPSPSQEPKPIHDEAGKTTEPPLPSNPSTPPRTYEQRSLSEVLIENARITAEGKGKDLLIEEMRDDKKFLRAELEEARKLRGDTKDIAERMLRTLETISLGGRLEPLNEAPNDGGNQVGDTDTEQN